jgi:hypothetical protein
MTDKNSHVLTCGNIKEVQSFFIYISCLPHIHILHTKQCYICKRNYISTESDGKNTLLDCIYT